MLPTVEEVELFFDKLQVMRQLKHVITKYSPVFESPLTDKLVVLPSAYATTRGHITAVCKSLLEVKYNGDVYICGTLDKTCITNIVAYPGNECVEHHRQF